MTIQKPAVYLSIVLAAASFFVVACRKDFSSDTFRQSRAERFFAIPANTTPAILEKITKLKAWNDKTGFVDKLPEKIGYPVWNKIIGLKSGSTFRETEGGGEEVYAIPTTEDGEYLSGSIIVREEPGETIEITPYTNEFLYVLTHASNVDIRQARALLAFFVTLDFHTFNACRFTNIPKTLFDGPLWPDNSLTTTVTIDTAALAAQLRVNPNCMTVTYMTGGYHCGTPTFTTCNGPEGCDILRDACMTDACYWVQETQIWCISGGGFADVSEIIPPAPTTGTGGGAGSSGGTGETPCGGSWYRPRGCEDPPSTTPEDTDPCTVAHNAAKELDSMYIKANMQAKLDSIGNLDTATREKGFPILKKKRVDPYNPSIITIVGYKCGDIVTGTDSSISFNFSMPYLYEYGATLHTHPHGGYTAHSPDDIYHLIAERSTNSYYEASYVVGYDSSQYAITITDFARAGQFLNTRAQNLNGVNWDESSEIGKAFKRAYKDFFQLYKKNPRQENLAYEMATAAVLSEFNTGVTLYKKDAMGNFKPLVVKTTTPNPRKPETKTYTQDCL